MSLNRLARKHSQSSDAKLILPLKYSLQVDWRRVDVIASGNQGEISISYFDRREEQIIRARTDESPSSSSVCYFSIQSPFVCFFPIGNESWLFKTRVTLIKSLRARVRVCEIPFFSLSRSMETSLSVVDDAISRSPSVIGRHVGALEYLLVFIIFENNLSCIG